MQKKRRRREFQSVRELLEKAKVTDDDMLPHHVCVWKEATNDDAITEFSNRRETRVAADILLCGPASLEQVKAGFKNKVDNVLCVELRLPKTFFSARRMAVKTADIADIAPAPVPRLVERAHAMTRVSAHRDKLEEIKEANPEGKIDFEIKLLIAVEGFTRRDDCGGTDRGGGQALQIATCMHKDPVMQQTN